MKRISYLILLIFSVFSLCSCSSAGGISTYTLPVSKMPSNFDPQSATADSDLLVITNIFDGLFEKQDDRIVNNLAESYTVSSDGKKYTIKIKSDSVWHCKTDDEKKYDGTAVTAYDFEFAFKRLLNPKTQSSYAKDFMNIKNAEAVYNGGDSYLLGVNAVDENTLVIELEQPDYNFTEKLCSTATFPCNEEFFNSTGGAYGLSIKNILSNGPFRLNYIDDENATIVKNSDGYSSLERIRLVLLSETEQAQNYSDDKISGYFSYGKSEILSGTKSQGFNSEVISLVFNLNNSQLKNTYIRQALSWYIYSYTNSGANPDVVSPAVSVFPDTITLAGKYINDIVKAETPSYMSENPRDLYHAGITELGVSKLGSMTLLLPENDSLSAIYENVNQLWQKNFDRYFKIEYLPVAEIRQRILTGNYDMAILPLSPSDNSVYSVIDNYSDYDDEIKNLSDTAKSYFDQNDAVSYISNAQKIIIENAYATPVGNEIMVYNHRDYFSDVYVNPFTRVVNLKHTKVN